MTHILFNMFALYIIGIGIERNVDRVIYIGMYLFSGLFGSMVSLYVHQNAVGTGASGAIFGIFGLLVAIVIVNRERLGSRSTKMLKEFGVLLVLNIGIGVMFESVDLSAHIAGFLTGLIAGMIVVKKPTLFWWIMLLCIVLLWILARELPTLHIFYNQ
jgi:membrane associated rhomboid family serine protease